MTEITLAITGASGAPYAKRLLQVLLDNGVHVHLLISKAAQMVMAVEHKEPWPSQHDKLKDYIRAQVSSGGTLSVYSKEELRALADVLVDYPDIIIVSDEIYEHINFSGRHFSIAQFEDMYDRTVTVNGVSKAFSMTGWRIGYIGGPSYIARACNKMQGQVTSGANCIAQIATIKALETPPSAIQYMVDAFKERRSLILSLLGDIPGFKTNVPEGAFYVFPDISYYIGRTLKGQNINSAGDFALFLLEYAGVATVTGEAFGDPDCIRISYAASEKDIKDAMNRIKEALADATMQ